MTRQTRHPITYTVCTMLLLLLLSAFPPSAALASTVSLAVIQSSFLWWTMTATLCMGSPGSSNLRAEQLGHSPRRHGDNSLVDREDHSAAVTNARRQIHDHRYSTHLTTKPNNGHASRSPRSISTPADANSNPRSVTETDSNNDDPNTTDADARIINGRDATPGRHPYMVSFRFYDTEVCGATLIAPDLVLTAAHCVENAPATIFLSVVIDPHNVDDPDSQSELLYVRQVVSHPDYIEEPFLRNDIAILWLWNSAKLHDPIKLNANPRIPTDGQYPMAVIGWGDTSSGNDEYPSVLQFFDDTTYVANPRCQAILDFYFIDAGGAIQDDTLCLVANRNNFGTTCFGDSGGPVLVLGDEPSQDIQVGITSWGIDECSNPSMPSMYARVSWFYPFIREHVCGLSDEPPASFGCGATPAPTVSPTSTSTGPPTSAPTSRPSDNPTGAPTSMPTIAQPSGTTSMPTGASPSNSDTAAPSPSPASSPSKVTDNSGWEESPPSAEDGDIASSNAGGNGDETYTPSASVDTVPDGSDGSDSSAAICTMTKAMAAISVSTACTVMLFIQS